MEVILKLLGLSVLLVSLPSFALNLATIETKAYPEIDIRNVHNKDLQREMKGEAPRFAIERYTQVSPMLDQNFQKEAGKLVWRYRVKATNAVSLNFAFTKFKMSETSELNIYATDFSQRIRPFTASDNNETNELWTPVIYADDVIIELVMNEQDLGKVELELTQINQGYRTFAETTEKSGSCNVDVVCSEGDNWRDEINAVGVISTGGSTFCTGFMVNNTSNDKTPYFMTANHCRIGARNSSSLVVYWNYQASSCGGRRNGSKDEFSTGSKLLASSAKSDFALVKLNKMPEAKWGVTYAGFDATGEDASSAVAIHHPSTDEKAISFEYDPTTVTSYLGEDVPGAGTHIRVEDWDVGTTEPGSSGSPLFNQDHRVIGQLHGGYASCSSQTSDWYGRIHVSWEGEGSASTRLKDHLDPTNSGVLITDTIK